MTLVAEIEKPIQLLVEGKGQLNFFDAFLRHLELRDKLQLHDFGGVDELRYFLDMFVKSSGFETVTSIGIVRDAEKDATAARQSVEGSLRNAGLSLPEHAERQAGSPAVHVLIFPGGGEPGMLETLLCRSIADEPVNGCIDEFFGCIEGLPTADIRRPDKARAQAYLAARLRPGVSVGVAAQQGYWPLDHPAFAGVRSFLKALKNGGRG